MRTRNTLGAVGLAVLVAAAGSAFTATSTIDDAAINVGSVAQSISGVDFSNVVHTYTAATDTTTAISAKAEQLVSEDAGVVTVTVNGGAPQACTVTQTDLLNDDVDTGLTEYSDVACDITDTVNVTAIRFIVNG